MACQLKWEYTDGYLYLNCRHVYLTGAITRTLEAEYLAHWLQDNQVEINQELENILVGLSSEQAFYVLLRAVSRSYPDWNEPYIVSPRPVFKAMTTTESFVNLPSWLDD